MSACVGVSDHAGWAVAITVSADGAFLDRRRVELVGAAMSCMPHHHGAQGLPEAEGVALVERVARSAAARSAACLDELASAVTEPIGAIALRACPPLPPTIAERITDYRAMCVADWVMYRQALAHAAEARGWAVQWFDPKRVDADAARALRRQSIDALLKRTGAALGPPWTKDHKLAMAAAVAATAI